MSDREAAIRALAEALQASNAHGPWEWQGGYPQRITNGAATLVADVFANPDAPPDLVAFIAACDPGTILGLLAELAAAREREAKLREAGTVVLRAVRRTDSVKALPDALQQLRAALADGEGET